MKHLVQLKVNGNSHDLMVSPNETLADALRRGLGLTGTKISCNQGDCGACTVLIDGKSQLSCITLAMSGQGKDIRTIEGLETNGELDPIQRAILEKQGVQCGFCTPGIIMSAGGVPIQVGGSLVGAVGVSGAPSGETDEQCAQAGVDAVLDDLEMSM